MPVTVRFPDYVFNEDIHMYCFHEWNVFIYIFLWQTRKFNSKSVLSFEKKLLRQVLVKFVMLPAQSIALANWFACMSACTSAIAQVSLTSLGFCFPKYDKAFRVGFFMKKNWRTKARKVHQLAIFAKSSILDVWQSFENASGSEYTFPKILEGSLSWKLEKLFLRKYSKRSQSRFFRKKYKIFF